MRLLLCLSLSLAALALPACGGGDDGVTGGPEKLTVYSGRAELLVGDLIEQFEEETGIDVEVRYGDSAELAATLAEEGDNSPADLFFAQDAGALGAAAERGQLEPLPPATVKRVVDSRFHDDRGRWAGVSARARVLAYNTGTVKEPELPKSVFELTEPRWKGRIGIAPTNASFQAFVSAMRIDVGDAKTREWLEGIEANDVEIYENNIQAVEAIAAGELDAALVNHYYLYEVEREQGEVPVENHFFGTGDPGALVNVAGIGIIEGNDSPDEARRFAAYLLSDEGQRYFADKTAEYPLVKGIEPSEELPPLKRVHGPFIDLGQLGEKLPSTLEMIEAAGLTN